MALPDAERARRYRDKIRGGPPRQLKPCPSPAARKRHQRNNEECAVCWPPKPLIEVLDNGPDPQETTP